MNAAASGADSAPTPRRSAPPAARCCSTARRSRPGCAPRWRSARRGSPRATDALPDWRWCRWGRIRPRACTCATSAASSLEAGIDSFAHDLPATTSEAQILALVHALNHDERVDGILVQLPLPKGVDANRVMDAVDPAKDVDGFHPVNTGLLAQKRPRLRPCTPFGVIRLAQEYGIALTGAAGDRGGCLQHRRPADGAGAAAGACHRHRVPHRHARPARRSRARRAAGRRGRQGRASSPGSGSARALRYSTSASTAPPTGTLVGDVEFASAAARAGWITPVPGGLGPMTIAMLLSNAVDAANLQGCA